MRLKILLPAKKLFDGEVDKITAEGEDGSFCLEEKHVDWVSPVVTGIVSCEQSGSDHFIAVDRGIIVKQGKNVLLSVRDAVKSDDLASLEETLQEHFEKLTEKEKSARSALAKLEADFARRFIEMEK